MKERIVGKRRGGLCRAAGFVFFVVLTLLPLSSQALPDKPSVGVGVIYGNGFELRISAAEGGTKIEYRNPGESGYQVMDLDSKKEGVQETADLSSWTIYGGAETEAVQNTSILMTGGNVHTIYGGGKARVTGNTSVIAVNKSDLDIQKISGGGDGEDDTSVGGLKNGYIETEGRFKGSVDRESFDRLFYSNTEEFKGKDRLIWRVKGKGVVFPDPSSYNKDGISVESDFLDLRLAEEAELILKKKIDMKKSDAKFLYFGSAKQIKAEVQGGILKNNLFYTKLFDEDIKYGALHEQQSFYTGKEYRASIVSFAPKKILGKNFKYYQEDPYIREYKDNVNAGTAWVIFKKTLDGEEFEAKKSYEIKKAKSFFEKAAGEADIGIYNKDVETKDFTYGDKIKVTAKIKVHNMQKEDFVREPKRKAELCVKDDEGTVIVLDEEEFISDELITFEYDTKKEKDKKALAIEEKALIEEKTLIIRYLGNTNIAECSKEVKINFSKRPLRAAVDQEDSSSRKVYDGKTKFDNVALKLENLLEGDELTAALSLETKDASVGENKAFTTLQALELQGDESKGYYYLEGVVSGGVTISPRELEVIWSDLEFDYDGKEHGPKAVFADSTQILGGDEAQLLLEVQGSATEVGKYTAEAVLIGDANENYQITNPKEEFEIRRASDPITPPPQPPSPNPPILIPDVPSPPQEPEEPQEEPETVEWEPRENTPIDKVWAIRLSLPLDPETLEEGNVYMEALDEPGKVIEAKLELSEDKKSIRIRPAQTFAYGREYRLYIRNLKTEDGRKLKNNVSMIFRTLAQ